MPSGSGGSSAAAADKPSVSSNIKLSLPEFDGDNWDEFKLAFTSAIGMNGWKGHLADDHAQQPDDAKIQKQIYWLLGSCCKKYAVTVVSAVPTGEGYNAYKALVDEYGRERVMQVSGLIKEYVGGTQGSLQYKKYVTKMKNILAQIKTATGNNKEKAWDLLEVVCLASGLNDQILSSQLSATMAVNEEAGKDFTFSQATKIIQAYYDPHSTAEKTDEQQNLALGLQHGGARPRQSGECFN